MIVEYPPLHFRYGPTPTWQELYISYPGSSLAAFTQMGLVRPDRFTWPIRSVSKCKRLLDELAELTRHLDVLGNADRIDRLAERIISETLLDAEEVVVDAAHRSLLELKGYVEEHYLEELDFDGVARKFGFSPSTFRRVWLKHMPESPVRFVNNLRMKQACRLLCETDLPIMEIAESLGYGDPLISPRISQAHRRNRARLPAALLVAHRGSVSGVCPEFDQFPLPKLDNRRASRQRSGACPSCASRSRCRSTASWPAPSQSVDNPLGIGGMRLHEWVFALAAWRATHGLEGGEVNESTPVVEESLANIGATVMGRNMFGGHPGPWDADEPWNGWWGDNPPFHHPVFVLTHHAREPLELEGGTTFTSSPTASSRRSIRRGAPPAARTSRSPAARSGPAVSRRRPRGRDGDQPRADAPRQRRAAVRWRGNDLHGLELVRTVATPKATHLKFARR